MTSESGMKGIVIGGVDVAHLPEQPEKRFVYAEGLDAADDASVLGGIAERGDCETGEIDKVSGDHIEKILGACRGKQRFDVVVYVVDLIEIEIAAVLEVAEDGGLGMDERAAAILNCGERAQFIALGEDDGGRKLGAAVFLLADEEVVQLDYDLLRSGIAPVSTAPQQRGDALELKRVD